MPIRLFDAHPAFKARTIQKAASWMLLFFVLFQQQTSEVIGIFGRFKKKQGIPRFHVCFEGSISLVFLKRGLKVITGDREKLLILGHVLP